MNYNIDLAIFIGFLVVNLAIGLYYGRGIKTIQEYTLGNRNFSTATIAATIVATWLSGASFTITVAETYSQGLYYIIPSLGDAMSFFITAYFYIPRMVEFLGKLSVAEAMGSIYDRRIRGITAISGIFPVIGNVAMQFCILAALLNYAFGLSSIYALLISSLVIIAYSTFGGIKAITFTDLIQFFTFGVVILIIAIVIWNSLAAPESIFSFLRQSPLFNFKEVFNYHNTDFWQRLFYFLFLMIPGIDSAIFQRISMSKNTAQASKAFIIAGFFIILCDLLINTFIGILLLMDNAPALDSINVIGYIIDTYLFPGLKGLFIIGIVAMIMSTADSYINSSAVLLAYDCSQCIGVKLTERRQLLLVKIASVAIALTSLTISLFAKDILDLVLAAYSFYMPIVSVPLILAIFGFRSTSKSVLIGMGAGFSTVILFKFVNNIDPIIPGMIANLTFFMSSHYLLKQSGGWIGIKDESSLIVLRLERKRKIDNLIQLTRSFSFMKLCINNLPKEERFYVYFGLFSILSSLSSVFSLPKNLYDLHNSLLIPIYSLSLIFSTLFITYPLWLAKFKTNLLIPILWNIAIFYNLAFTSIILVIINTFNPIQITVLIISLVTLSILLRWQIAIAMILGGVVSSIYYYKIYMGDMLPDVSHLQFKLTYILLLLSSILIAFLKPKQEYLEATEHKVGALETEVTHLGHEVTTLNERVTHYNERISDQEKEIERLGSTAQKILNNVNHELRLPIGNVINFSDMLHEALQKSDNKHIQILSKEVYNNSNRVSSMILNMLDLATLDVKKIDLLKKTINFSEMVEDRVKTCRKIYLQNKKIDFELIIEPEIMIAVDPNYIRQTIDNLVINAINFSDSGLIKVIVAKKNGQLIFTIIDQGKGIPQLELIDIFTPFKMGSNTESKAHGRGVGLALCKSTVEAHGGSITADSNGKIGATIRFILPL